MISVSLRIGLVAANRLFSWRSSCSARWHPTATSRAIALMLVEAAVEGAKVRFRPILMTSFAFIAGLIPLVRANGPGAVGNRTIGASALGGMVLGTLFGVVLVPGLYYAFAMLGEGKSLIKDEDELPVTEEVARRSVIPESTTEA